MKLKAIILFLLFSTIIFAENYKKIKVEITNKNEIIEIQKMGIPLDDAYQNKDGSLEFFVNENEFKALSQSTIKYEILINDWNNYYRENRIQTLNKLDVTYNQKYNVQSFTYGSMGGYYTLSEIWEKIDEMIANYPNLISVKDSIGASEEGRPIYAVRISDNPNINEDEPEVLYTALIHAREPESMMQMIYYMFYLLENYGTDNEVTYLIENREMYFVPVINPDGYYYNESTNPDGGGMWRKNRQYNSDGTYGVDLNRNFGYEWGYDNTGSSSIPSRETYRGEEPFSEVETQTIKNYCISHDFRLALNYHTYSNLLITPWGYKPEPTPDSVFYSEIASDMTQYNHYTWGFSSEIIYAVNGDSDDWFYGEQTEKNKIFAMTPEVGSGSDGFWPSQSRIIPLAEENVYPNLYLAWVAGGFANTLEAIFDKEYYAIPDTGFLSLTIKNKGLEAVNSIHVETSVSSNAELISGNYFDIGNIPERTEIPLENCIQFLVKKDALPGDSINFTLKYYSSDLLLSTDTYSFIIGVPSVVFAESFNNLDNWATESNTTTNWELTRDNFYSSPYSVTDSKDGGYLSNTTSSITTKNKINLKSVPKPYLRFKTKYDIESGWDYGQVLISTDSTNWNPIGGENSSLGSGGFQPYNQPIYDGYTGNWVTEIINVHEYAGTEIFIRFEFNSDESIVEDGWYIDDVEIFEYLDSTVSTVDDCEFPTKYALYQNYPNPFNPSTKISYQISVFSDVKLYVYDVLGQEVGVLVNREQKAGNYEVVFDASGLSSGVYFYKLQTGDFVQSMKMVLMK